MEFLDGELLSDLLERLRPAAMQRLQAWQIIRQLGAGLAHAHERGIVHGDLNPRNILVTRDGELRILGFGAAQTTPAYASCELLEVSPAADPRNDLYALACTCYELLNGAHPFAGRPATLARDYGVRATRPAGLTGRQWRTLQAGLSWHRAGRSMSIHAWIQKLTNGIAEKSWKTPLLELKAACAATPPLHTRAAALCRAAVDYRGGHRAASRRSLRRKPAKAWPLRRCRTPWMPRLRSSPPRRRRRLKLPSWTRGRRLQRMPRAA
jgi:serine/threonine protein kinase